MFKNLHSVKVLLSSVLLLMKVNLAFGVSNETVNILDLESYKSESVIKIDNSQSTVFYKNIPYSDGTFHKFDFFRVIESNEAPTVLYLHGGSFIGGDKSSSKIGKDVNRFLNAGVNFIALNYSLLNVDSIDPEGILKSMSDVAKAVQFIKLHQSELSIDVEKIAVYGESTGANIALWLGVSEDLADDASDDPILRQSTRVSAIGAVEAQASVDFVAWEQIIFSDYGFSLELLTQNDFSWYLASFYGLSNIPVHEVANKLRSNDVGITSYRKRIDVLSLLDANDPAIYMSNSRAPFDLLSILHNGEPQEILYAISHHQIHVATFYEAALRAGIDITAYAPEIGIESPAYNDVVDYLVSRIAN